MLCIRRFSHLTASNPAIVIWTEAVRYMNFNNQSALDKMIDIENWTNYWYRKPVYVSKHLYRAS